MRGDVIAGRECGQCNVCCVDLTIEDPQLTKVQGYRCPNLTAASGCGIYPKRPQTCRAFQCGWRVLPWVEPSLRPDRSGVLIRVEEPAIVITLLNAAAPDAEGLAETVAAAVAARRPVFLDVPGPPGHTSAVAQIDGALTEAVAARDKPALRELLREARALGQSGPTVPINLKPLAPPAPAVRAVPPPLTPAAEAADEAAPPVRTIPGRECGECNVCCVALTIDEPELQKPQGYRCRNALPDNRCAIYPSRPETCRKFQCGWKMLKWIQPGLRPDRSGVLVRIYETDGQLGISVTLLTQKALKAEGLAETVSAAVAAGRPVVLHVPGPPGYTAGFARIDEALAPAVAARNKAAVLDVLRVCYRKGRSGPTKPIRFEPRPGRPA